MESSSVKNTIEEILKLLSIEYESIEDTSTAEGLKFNIKTKESGILIGSRGEHISALNYLIKRIVLKGDENTRITVDINGYLDSSNEALRNRVKILAERAKSFKTSVELDPMSPYERMVVHAFLADDPHLETQSVGAGRNRRVVIKYKE